VRVGVEEMSPSVPSATDSANISADVDAAWLIILLCAFLHTAMRRNQISSGKVTSGGIAANTASNPHHHGHRRRKACSSIAA
jgi:hypothetical protein